MNINLDFHHISFRRGLLSFFLLLLILQVSAASVVKSDVKLTNRTDAGNPCWSPDGKKIAYASDEAIWIMNSDGSGRKKLYDSGAWEGEPEFNKEGNKLFFVTESKTAFSARYLSIHLMNTDGSGNTKLTENADCREPALSPDGSRVAYISHASGNYDIWMMDSDGGNATRITDDAGDERAPSWNPDGNTIVYSSGGNLYTTDIHSLVTQKLSNNSYNDIEPSFSPDGKIIAFCSDRSGNYDIWMMDSLGNSEAKITGDLFSERSPAWNPGGNEIAYISDRDGNYDIRVMSLNTSEIKFEPVLKNQDMEKDTANEGYVAALRKYAADRPLDFIVIAFIVSFSFVVLIVGSFLRRIT